MLKQKNLLASQRGHCRHKPRLLTHDVDVRDGGLREPELAPVDTSHARCLHDDELLDLDLGVSGTPALLDTHHIALHSRKGGLQPKSSGCWHPCPILGQLLRRIHRPDIAGGQLRLAKKRLFAVSRSPPPLGMPSLGVAVPRLFAVSRLPPPPEKGIPDITACKYALLRPGSAIVNRRCPTMPPPRRHW